MASYLPLTLRLFRSSRRREARTTRPSSELPWKTATQCKEQPAAGGVLARRACLPPAQAAARFQQNGDTNCLKLGHRHGRRRADRTIRGPRKLPVGIPTIYPPSGQDSSVWPRCASMVAICHKGSQLSKSTIRDSTEWHERDGTVCAPAVSVATLRIAWPAVLGLAGL